MISDSQLGEMLDRVESGLKSMMGYGSQSNPKLPDGSTRDFLAAQYDVRLGNFLEAAGTNIHHLESGIKNRIILRKQRFFDELGM